MPNGDENLPDVGQEAPRPLRYGWTTGACATAATKAAYTALLGGGFPDPVTIQLPKGQEPAFTLAHEGAGCDAGGNWARAGIIKDAGDDPDVTHGAMIVATVRHGAVGKGVVFRAGPGVGMVTKPGLPIPPGEPAINPSPRNMIREAVDDVARSFGVKGDVVVEISVPGGEEIAKQTWNPRLGIVGGISILGTTGVVVPYSCSAWIHSIHRGIDVARALGYSHVAASVGSTSERMVQGIYHLPETALIDMGDFAGGLLKYLRRHPVSRVTIAGGFAKMSKLANGALDLHSGRSQVDTEFLAGLMGELGADEAVLVRVRAANTALEILQIAEALEFPLADAVAARARHKAIENLRGAEVDVEILVADRNGGLIARSG